MISLTNKRPQVAQTHIMSPLQYDILKTLLYFDIFDHPLKFEEIYQFLPSNSATPADIQLACITEPLSGILDVNGLFCSLRHNGKSTADQRLQKEVQAGEFWTFAIRFAAMMKYLPFVRAIFVSGELSKGVASKESDVDFLVITAPKRLWHCRILFLIFKRMLPKKSRKLLCFNTFVSEEALEYPSRNLYSATEIATLKVLYNENLYSAYLDSNKWVHSFLPNFQVREQEFPAIDEHIPSIQKLYGLLFSARFFDKLDEWLMSLWRRLITLKFSDVPPGERERLFVCTPVFCSGYSMDHERRILDIYDRQLKTLNVEGNSRTSRGT